MIVSSHAIRSAADTRETVRSMPLSGGRSRVTTLSRFGASDLVSDGVAGGASADHVACLVLWFEERGR